MEEQEIIESIKTKAKRDYIPIVRDNTIEKIVDIIREENYNDLLEIGTAIGYSGSIMLLKTEDTNLYTIEKDQNRFNEAIKNFSLFKLEKRVKAVCNDAKNELEKLCQEGKKFDFIFLDGPKGQYIAYLPYIKKLLKGGGTLFADNILLGGLIKEQERVNHKNRTMTVKMKKFIEEMKLDRDFDTIFCEIDDGYMISKLKKIIE